MRLITQRSVVEIHSGNQWPLREGPVYAAFPALATSRAITAFASYILTVCSVPFPVLGTIGSKVPVGRPPYATAASRSASAEACV